MCCLTVYMRIWIEWRINHLFLCLNQRETMTWKQAESRGKITSSVTSPWSLIWCMACTSRLSGALTATVCLWRSNHTWTSHCQYQRLSSSKSNSFGFRSIRARGASYSTLPSRATSRLAISRNLSAMPSMSTSIASTLCWFKTMLWGGSCQNTSFSQSSVAAAFQTQPLLPLKPTRRLWGRATGNQPALTLDTLLETTLNTRVLLLHKDLLRIHKQTS